MESVPLRIVREPRVTVVARQEFVYPEHIHWESDSDVPGQVLPEFAGRLCFDDETEVLTRDGWRRFSEIDGSEEVLTKHPRTGHAEYQRPVAYHRYDYDGDLWCAEGRDVSLAVTPEHRQWGRFRHASGRLGEYGFVRTDEIGSRIFALDGAADAWSGRFPESVEIPEAGWSQRLANAVGQYGTRSATLPAVSIRGEERIGALARLCAYYVTEGSLRRQRGAGQGIVIYGDHVASVLGLCDVLGLPRTVWTDPRGGVERVLVGGGVQWRSFFERECGSGSVNKRLPRWVLDLPRDTLQEVWRILVRTDGHVYASGREALVTTSPEFAGQCQEILCKLGFKSSATKQSPSQGTNHRTYLVSRKSPRPILLNRRVPLRARPYRGEVFCLTVPNGTLFVRRHGKPHFSGNCYLSFGADAGLEGGHKTIGGRTTNEAYLANILKVKHGSVLEHAVWSLLIEGVSRALTHELVRHRAGFGFCLTGDTLVYSEHRVRGRRDGAKKRTLRDIYRMSLTPHGRSRLKLLRLRCLDEQTGTFTTGRVAGVVRSGEKPVFRVELEDGKSITCSRDHRFLTPSGWQSLDSLAGGIEVSPGGVATWGNPDAEILVNGVQAYRDADWLRRQYHENGFDQATIARMAGVSPHTIRAWIRKHELQKEPGSWTLGVSPWNKGRRYRAGWHHSDETRRRLSEQKCGEANPAWKGGITPQSIVIRRGVELLRERVYERDGHRCRVCRRRGGRLTIHHVLPVWFRPDLVEEESNLATVCRGCHQSLNGRELDALPLFGRTALPTEEQPRTGRGNLLVPRRRRVVAITYVGVQPTYDLEMEGPNHNFVANGIVTHNSQLSQRYVDESDIAFVLPPEILEGSRAFDAWMGACEGSLVGYREILREMTEQIGDEGAATMRKKRARQAARSVLPNAAETKIVVTGNARAWRHFVEMRGSASADVEIRRLAVLVLRNLHAEAPGLFGDLHIFPQSDGTEVVETANSKV